MTREETHKFTLDMKFRIGDKVKKQPKWKDDTVYEVYGFEYYNHANGQCAGISYQLLDPEGEYGNWTREDTLELYHEPETVSIPITEEEKRELTYLYVKYKKSGSVNAISAKYTLNNKHFFYFLNPSTQCWEEWSEELEKELMR